MKNKYLLTLIGTGLLLSTAAQADQQSPLYMTPDEKFTSETVVSLPSYSNDDMDVDMTGTIVNETLSYGINDKFEIGLTLAYSDWKLDDMDIGYGAMDLSNKGLKDPEINMIYRMLDQKTSDVNLDLLANARIQVADAEIKDDGEGNYFILRDLTTAQEGNSIALGARVGKDIDKFTFAVGALVDYHFSGEVDLDGLATVDTDAYTDFTLNMATQYRFNDKWSMNGELAYKMIDDLVVEGETLGEYDDRLTFTLQGNYAFTANALGSLYASYVDEGDDFDGYDLGVKATFEF